MCLQRVKEAVICVSRRPLIEIETSKIHVNIFCLCFTNLKYTSSYNQMYLFSKVMVNSVDAYYYTCINIVVYVNKQSLYCKCELLLINNAFRPYVIV